MLVLLCMLYEIRYVTWQPNAKTFPRAYYEYQPVFGLQADPLSPQNNDRTQVYSRSLFRLRKKLGKKGKVHLKWRPKRNKRIMLPNPNLLSSCKFQLNNRHRTPPVRKDQYTHYWSICAYSFNLVDPRLYQIPIWFQFYILLKSSQAIL